MLCKYCGAQLPDGTEKCEFCGARLTAEKPQENTTPENETVEETEAPEEEILDENELKRRAQMEKMMAEKQQQLSEIEKRRNTKKKRQKQTKIAVICAVCAACAAIIGFGSYAIKESLSDKPEPTPTPIPTVTAPAVPTPLTTTPAPLGDASGSGTDEEENGAIRVLESDGNGSGSASGGTGSAASGGSQTSGSASGGTGGTASGGSRTNASSGASSASSGTSGKTSSSAGTASSSASAATALSSAKASGASSNNIDSAYTVGGEVIYNKSTGRYLMTFASGNTLYYANVSEGSTTEQINNKSITVTAYPTEEKYNGNTVYEITDMLYHNDADYVIPHSSSRLLTKDELRSMSADKLALARNEIYARHGRKFQMAQFRDYFSSKSWYKENPNYNYDDEASNLSSTEIKNVNLLLSIEKSKQ